MNWGAPRDRKKEAYWRRLMRRQIRSGLSVRAWCRRHDLREANFYRWRTELARRDDEDPRLRDESPRLRRGRVEAVKAPPTFVPVRIAAEAVTNADYGSSIGDASRPATTSEVGRIEIVLKGGRRVHLSGRVDRAMLADVVAVLEERAAGEGEAERGERIRQKKGVEPRERAARRKWAVQEERPC